MSDHPFPGIYLIVQFDWPPEVDQDLAKSARTLHDLTQDQTWIKETVAASGGVGAGPSSVWIFWLENYAALDRLLHDYEDPICKAYIAFFSQMPLVQETTRGQVLFA